MPVMSAVFMTSPRDCKQVVGGIVGKRPGAVNPSAGPADVARSVGGNTMPCSRSAEDVCHAGPLLRRHAPQPVPRVCPHARRRAGLLSATVRPVDDLRLVSRPPRLRVGLKVVSDLSVAPLACASGSKSFQE